MRPKTPYFALIHSGKTVAVIQGPTKGVARERATLIESHIVRVPSDCRVKRVDYRAVRHAPVFSEDFFLSIEEALLQASGQSLL